MKIRVKLMLFLYGWSSIIYTAVFKWNKKAWGISKSMFYEYQQDSLGYALGEFYHSKGFEVMPKLENHDVFHLLTEMDTEIEDEVAMQYLLLGNGKTSFYLYGMLIVGTVLFPEYLNYYARSFRKGKAMNRFFDIEFKEYLNTPLPFLKHSFAKK